MALTMPGGNKAQSLGCLPMAIPNLGQPQAAIATQTSMAPIAAAQTVDVVPPAATAVNQTIQTTARLHGPEAAMASEGETAQQVLELEQLREATVGLERERQHIQDKVKAQKESHSISKRNLLKVTEDWTRAVTAREGTLSEVQAAHRIQEEYKQKCNDLEAESAASVQKRSAFESMWKSEQLHAAKREQELQDNLLKAKKDIERVMDEQVTLDDEIEKMAQGKHSMEEKVRGLQSECNMLQKELRNDQDQLLRSEHNQKRTEEQMRNWYQDFMNANKENAALQHCSRENKKLLANLDGRLQQEQDHHPILTPGDFLKAMMNQQEMADGENGRCFMHENSMLKKELKKREMDLELSNRKLRELNVNSR